MDAKGLTLDDLLAAKQALRDLPGWQVRADLRMLERSLGVFTGNADELLGLLGKGKDPAFILPMWDQNKPQLLERYLDEVDRLLHNFVAADLSFKEHRTGVWKRLRPSDQADPFRREYDQRVGRDFARSPLAQFVQRLRNYAQHHRLPIATGRLSWARDKPLESHVVLPTRELLKWELWNEAESYIVAAGDELVVADVVAEYRPVVVEFHAWFRGAVQTSQAANLAAFQVAAVDHNRSALRAFGAPPPDTAAE